MIRKLLALLISFFMMIPQCLNVFAVDEIPADTDETDSTTETIAEKEIPETVNPLDDSDKDIRDISLDETVSVDIDENDNMIYYRFVPETDEYYVFESFAENKDPYCYLFDSSFQSISSDDDSAGNMNFRLKAWLNGGQEYYFGVHLYSGYPGTFDAKLSIYEKPALTSFAFVKDAFALRTDSSSYIYSLLSYTPYDAEPKLEITSADPDVIRVNDLYLEGVSKGSTTVTVTADGQYTTSAVFTVGNYATQIRRENWNQIRIPAGDSVQLEYIVEPQNEDVSDEQVTWSISWVDNDCISLSSDGLVTGLAGGYAEVKAEIMNGSYVSYSISVYEQPTEISFVREVSGLSLGSSRDISNYISFTPSSAYSCPYTVTSSDESIIRVQDRQLYGVAKGNADITVTAENGVSATGRFKVGNFADYIISEQDYWITMSPGDSAELAYSLGRYDGGTCEDEEVAWSVRDNYNDCVSVDQNGTVTALRGGSATVIASISNGNGISYGIQVKENPTSLSFRKDEFGARPEKSYNIWDYLEYQPYNAYGASLDITSSDPDVITVESNYIVTRSKGTAEITVTSRNGLSDSALFTVGAFADSINPKGSQNVYLETGQTRQLEYELYPTDEDISDEVITWTLSYDNNGAISVDENGVVTAHSSGYAEVKATIRNGSSAYYYITAADAPESLYFREDLYYLDRQYGHNIWNYLSYSPNSSYGYPLTITVSDPDIIGVNGTYIYGNQKGTASVTVSTPGGLSASAEFIVGDYASSIWSKESDVYVKPGDSVQLEYELYTGEYGAADEEIVWRITSGAGCASVDQNGLVTAIRNGTAYVEARIKNGDSTTFTVHVYTDPERLAFKEDTNYLDKYYQHFIWNYLDCSPQNAEGSPLTITSGDENVVRVTGTNLVGVSNGTATVTVKSENGLEASAVFTVGDYAASISSDQYSYYLTLGESTQLKYILRPEGNAFADEKITWSISGTDKKVIRLDQNGNVTGLKTGTQEVIATTRNGSATNFIVTVNPLPKKIAFTALDEYVAVNTSRNINGMLVTVPDIYGGVSFIASSGNEQVAKIQDGTNVYGVSKGMTVLSVKTEEGLIAKTRLHVGNYAPSLNPKGSSDVIMAPGETKKLEFTVGGNADYSDDEFTWNLYYSEDDPIRLSSDGTVTAVRSGYATVTVTSLTGAQAWFYIYVQNQPTSLSFDEEEYSEEIGYPLSLYVNSDTELRGESRLIWTTSDPSVVAINYNYGTYAEVCGQKEGTATIRAALRDNPEVYAETKVTAYKPVEPTAIVIPSSLTSYVNYYQEVPVNVTPEKGSRDFVVETGNDNVIVQNVSRNSIRLLGNKAGTCVVTVMSADGKVSARTTVTVKDTNPAETGYFYIDHVIGNSYYGYVSDPAEFVCVVGETYNFETSLFYGEYSPWSVPGASEAIEECGLFENVRMRGAGGVYGQMFVSFFATASEAGTAEVEMVPGKTCRFTVIDSAWLGTKVTAGNSIPSAVVNELKNSDLNLKYDIAFAAAETLGQQKLSVPANKKAVLQSWLEINVDSYVKDALGNIRYTLTLTPKFKVVTMNKTADSTSAGDDLIAESEPTISVPAQMVIPVKESIGNANVRRLSITHQTNDGEEYEYTDALLDEGLLFIDQDNGYGTFSIKAETSSYKEPVYTWTQKGEGYEVTALAQSEEGDPDITETVTAVYTVVEEAECFKAGKGVYTATFTNPLFDTQTMNVSIPAIGHHDYGTPQYTWSNDLSKVTASAICKVCGDEVKETVNTTYAVIKEPTKTETGTGRYTAVFTNALFETQTKDIVIPATGSGSDIIRIWFTQDEYTMTAGKNMVLIAHTDPEETTDTITFTSSDPSIVSNESNLLTAHKAGRVTITAKASNGVQAQCSILVLFTDASDPNKFFYNPVYWAFEHDPQITTGTSGTTFSPNENCTRGHIVTFLYRAAGEPKVSGKMPFTDVKEGKFYYNAVLWAVQNNITTGTSATTFSPNENCTRGHIVTFLYRYLKEPSVSGTVPFNDVKPGKFYYNAVLWAVKNNITTGTSSTTFSPNDNCTRGQAVTFLYRAVK